MDQRSYNTMAMGRSMDLLTKDENSNFWERRTRVEQILIVMCSILAFSAIGLIIAVIVLANKQAVPGDTTTTEAPVTVTTAPTPVIDEECTSSVCKYAADQLIASINDSIDPCDDFYSYVCSGWRKDNQIPDDLDIYTRFDVLSENIINKLKRVLPNTTFEDADVRSKTKIFYSSCIDNDTREGKGVEGLKNILQNLGGWPLLGNNLTDYVWLDALAYAITELSVSPIIVVGVATDAKNTTRNIIQMDQTSLSLGRNVLINMNTSNDRIEVILTAYKNFIKKSAQILGSEKNETDLDADIDDMIQFEKSLAELTRPQEARRDPNSLYNNMTVYSLSMVIKEIDIVSFLSKVFNNTIKVTGDMDINVIEFDYLYEISKLLSGNTIKRETIANFIGWRVVGTYGSETTQEFRDAELEFSKVMLGIKEATPLDETCIGITNNYFDFALGSVYINNDFDIDTKTEIENMINQTKIAFGELLKTNVWMNDESRKEAENKLSKMVPMVAFPPWINDTKELNEYYEKVGDIKEDAFFENVISLAKFSSQKVLNKINEPHNRSEQWLTSPAIVNAFYSPSGNTITFPAGILKFPFYEVGLPPALNFAGIGSVIGHEITHGFDDEGRQYDAEGNLKDWWPADVKERFINESKCFVEQYGNYTEPVTGMTLNGKNTLGENIADNGGIREAFKAYKSVAAKIGRNIKLPGLNLTADQLFFVSYSYVWCTNERKENLEYLIQYNHHSPARFRVQVPFSNFEEFSKTFSCPANSTMNPEHRCLLW